MALIIELLRQKTDELKEFRQLEILKANKAQQDVTDSKFQAFISDMDQFIEALGYANNELNFPIDDDLKNKIKTLLSQSQEIIKTGYADKELLKSAQNEFKHVRSVVREEWKSHYTELTSPKTTTLAIINAIESERVNLCLTNIKAAEGWSDSKSTLKKLKAALDEASELIHALNIDDRIILFLTKMNSRQASLADLDHTVLEWIKKENLETRVRLTFIS